MFTGLVESLGTVVRFEPESSGGSRLTVRHPGYAGQLAMGESVAVNGVCLTVVEFSGDQFSFQVGPETLERSNLGGLGAGQRVNLERSLRVGDRLGGHFVQGHVDAQGVILSREIQGEWEMVWFGCPPELTRLMVHKGSIAVDGVSLTLVEVREDRFLIMLIPHTLQETTLGFKEVGDRVNLETDLIARHIQQLMRR